MYASIDSLSISRWECRYHSVYVFRYTIFGWVRNTSTLVRKLYVRSCVSLILSHSLAYCVYVFCVAVKAFKAMSIHPPKRNEWLFPLYWLWVYCVFCGPGIVRLPMHHASKVCTHLLGRGTDTGCDHLANRCRLISLKALLSLRIGTKQRQSVSRPTAGVCVSFFGCVYVCISGSYVINAQGV